MTSVSPDEDPLKGRSPEYHMLTSSAWRVAMRWTVRGIGMLSTLVLLRLLTPTDFGLLAMATVLLGLCEELFSTSGERLALIRHPAPTLEHYHSAWTLVVIKGGLASVVLLVAAPAVGLFFNEPRAVDLVQILAIRPLLAALENIGTVDFSRRLQFHFDFWLYVGQKLTHTLVVLTLAIVWRDYWALIATLLITPLINIVISYSVHPLRPRLTLSKARELFGYSTAMLLVRFGGFVASRVDEILVGRLFGVAAMGNFVVAADVARMTVGETIMPASQSLFAVYAKLLGNPAQLKDKFLGALAVIAYAGLSMGFGIALIAADLTAVVLGPAWTDSAPLVAWLGISVALFTIIDPPLTLLTALGDARGPAIFQWSRLTVTVPAAIAGGLAFGVVGIAAARTLAGIAFLPLPFVFLNRHLPVTIGEIAAVLWRPAIATLVMAAALIAGASLPIDSAAIRLVLAVPAGALVFGGTGLLLWVASGQPPGPERAAVRSLAWLLRRFARPRAAATSAARPGSDA